MFANRFSPAVRPSGRPLVAGPQCPSVSVRVRPHPRPCPLVSVRVWLTSAGGMSICLLKTEPSCQQRQQQRKQQQQHLEQKHVTMGKCSRAPRRMSNFCGMKRSFFRSSKEMAALFWPSLSLSSLCGTCLRVFLKSFSAAFSPFMGFPWCVYRIILQWFLALKFNIKWKSNGFATLQLKDIPNKF